MGTFLFAFAFIGLILFIGFCLLYLVYLVFAFIWDMFSGS